MTALAYDDVNGLKSLQVCGARVVVLHVLHTARSPTYLACAAAEKAGAAACTHQVRTATLPHPPHKPQPLPQSHRRHRCLHHSPPACCRALEADNKKLRSQHTASKSAAKQLRSKLAAAQAEVKRLRARVRSAVIAKQAATAKAARQQAAADTSSSSHRDGPKRGQLVPLKRRAVGKRAALSGAASGGGGGGEEATSTTAAGNTITTAASACVSTVQSHGRGLPRGRSASVVSATPAAPPSVVSIATAGVDMSMSSLLSSVLAFYQARPDDDSTSGTAVVLGGCGSLQGLEGVMASVAGALAQSRASSPLTQHLLWFMWSYLQRLVLANATATAAGTGGSTRAATRKPTTRRSMPPRRVQRQPLPSPFQLPLQATAWAGDGQGAGSDPTAGVNGVADSSAVAAAAAGLVYVLLGDGGRYDGGVDRRGDASMDVPSMHNQPAQPANTNVAAPVDASAGGAGAGDGDDTGDGAGAGGDAGEGVTDTAANPTTARDDTRIDTSAYASLGLWGPATSASATTVNASTASGAAPDGNLSTSSVPLRRSIESVGPVSVRSGVLPQPVVQPSSVDQPSAGVGTPQSSAGGSSDHGIATALPSGSGVAPQSDAASVVSVWQYAGIATSQEASLQTRVLAACVAGLLATASSHVLASSRALLSALCSEEVRCTRCAVCWVVAPV